MSNLLRPVDEKEYFSDPDMPFFGYPKTEENVAAIKQLWDDTKPKATIGDALTYGEPEKGNSAHETIMGMFYDEGYYL